MYYLHKMKCLVCSLHYAIYSHQETVENKPYCPECGATGSKMIWGPEKYGGEIFEEIPGDTGLTEMT